MKLLSYFFLLMVLTTISCSKPLEPDRIITVDTQVTYQTMDNFGAAGCWFGEGIGKYWPHEKKERIAELLFSKAVDSLGNPKGIGLSSWRFNIGAGTQEQGDSSGISDFRKRVECFLNSDGTYDWSKQEGYQWFLKQAKHYDVEQLIAFSNSPPVQFTENGLGYKLNKDFKTNLRAEHFKDYVQFLTQVLSHFEESGIHFDYISPCNEPQWDWFGEFGTAKQEGTPWSNANISEIAKLLDSTLTASQLETDILITEAAQLNFLYEGNGHAHQQIANLFHPDSSLYVGDLKHMPNIIAAHSYFTDNSDDQIISVREKVGEATKQANLKFWESEYSMLANGYKDGHKGKRTAMDCALFLAKIIHFDITKANASAWQFWNAFEPGDSDFDTKYYFIALDPNEAYTDGEFSPVKNLWSMGHYSRFVRPGMVRVEVNTGMTDLESAQSLMSSAYLDEESGRLVVIVINYSEKDQLIKLDVNGSNYYRFTQFTTSAEEDMNLYKEEENKLLDEGFNIHGKSIVTLVLDSKFE
ncbi:hypothetical protein LRR18_12100 [Mangrovimonas sp. AS39]|uniref:glycoside hydrolase n=1 Tax=Mangrovimonas futianensis TaxID=2895523 RepID=UPI001E650C7F|nr:glycoside hydrolase [Mangrovimonas futianensis]MCF1192328.1 hypothetical protein [Mangrovimonas futianensis]MCF1195923.1 hypothetical protein [Mangrovimonas futianensis]